MGSSGVELGIFVFCVGCDGVLRFLLRSFIFVFIPSVCGVGHFEMVVGAVGRKQTVDFEGKCRSSVGVSF